MSILNIVLFTISYSTLFKPQYHVNNQINIVMNQNDFNTDEVLGLKLLKPNETKDLTIKWLYKSLEEDYIHPSIVLHDLVSTLSYSIKEPEPYDLFIGYKPNKFEEEPHFIGYFCIKPDRKMLTVEQICTNPNVKNPSFTNFKNKITILAQKSNVLLYPQPLKYISNPRYYLEFTQSF